MPTLLQVRHLKVGFEYNYNDVGYLLPLFLLDPGNNGEPAAGAEG